jgi:hypothetical protein
MYAYNIKDRKRIKVRIRFFMNKKAAKTEKATVICPSMPIYSIERPSLLH